MTTVAGLTIHDVVQGSPEWLELRRGIVTASTVGQLITPSTLKVAGNDKSRALVSQLVAERITGWVEEPYVSNDMWRGRMDEPLARDLYSKTYAPVTQCGFMTLKMPSLKLGYSPDGLVGDDGLIEVKSHAPKKHVAIVLADEVPIEHVPQCQAGLFVSGRSWVDYLSYCGGMPMWRKRVTPDLEWFTAITEAVRGFEDTAAHMIAAYTTAVKGLPQTERIEYLPEARI